MGIDGAFLDWDVEAVAQIDEAGVEARAQDQSIIRHRGKIESTIANAQATLLLREQGLSLAGIVWGLCRSLERAARRYPASDGGVAGDVA